MPEQCPECSEAINEGERTTTLGGRELHQICAIEHRLGRMADTIAELRTIAENASANAQFATR